MTDKDILSQEEIDALLQNVDDENIDKDELLADGKADTEQSVSKEDQDSLENSEAKVVDFVQQERIVRGQFPVLDRIHDRTVKMFMDDVYGLMAREMTVEQKPVKIHKYHEFISLLEVPSMVNIYRFRPLRGKVMVLFDATFVFNLVDNYFGGSSQFNSQIDRLDFTPTEIRIIEIFTNKLLKNIEKSWARIMPLQTVKVAEETNPQLVNIAEPNDLMLVNRFKVAFEKPAGQFYIVLPYSMIEPIKQQLELGASRSDDDVDPNWTNSLVNELLEVQLSISSTLGTASLPLSHVNELSVGDFIPLEIKDTVTLDIEGIPSFKASVGSADEKSALKIIEKITY